MPKVCYHSEVPVPADALYAWHERAGAFQRLSPPWMDVRVIKAIDRLVDGERAILEIKQGPVSQRWELEHFDVTPGQHFRDRQVSGPFKRWQHTHRCQHVGEGRSRLVEEIEYELPAAPVSHGIGGRLADRELDRLFFYRHAIMGSDFARFGSQQPGRGKTVLISGHTGLIGRRLVALLRTLGFAVRGLTRSPRADWEFRWDYHSNELDPAALEGVDAVVHLAGENIAGGPWTDARRRRIRESREQGTHLIARRLAEASPRPAVLISASGANFYPTDGTPSTEEQGKGDSFLSEVCEAWEGSADRARAAGVRVVHPRIAAVLTPEGGALSKMLPAFHAGLGGRIGSGEQHFAWVSIEDVIGVIVAAILDERYEGPVNVAAPEVVTQREFAQALGRVLNRPTVLPLPGFAIRTVLGQMGEEALLGDVHVIPQRLKELGYPWRQPGLEAALRVLLGRPRPHEIPRLTGAAC